MKQTQKTLFILACLLLVSTGIFVGCSNDDDDDNQPTVNYAVTISGSSTVEESNTVEFTVTLDQTNETGQAIPVAFTVSGTATAGIDYQAPSSTTLSIADGQTSASFSNNGTVPASSCFEIIS